MEKASEEEKNLIRKSVDQWTLDSLRKLAFIVSWTILKSLQINVLLFVEQLEHVGRISFNTEKPFVSYGEKKADR